MIWRPKRLTLGPRKRCMVVLLTGYLLVYSAAPPWCQELFRQRHAISLRCSRRISRTGRFSKSLKPLGASLGWEVSRHEHIGRYEKQR
jgi:hypothetical protein